jgi:hypothetical protein
MMVGLVLLGQRDLVFFPGDNVNQKVKHVRLCDGCCNVAALKGSSLVFFSMDPILFEKKNE